MAKTPIPPPGDDDPEVADAYQLFRDEPARPSPAPSAGSRAADHDAGGSYDVEEVEEPPARPAAAPVPPVPPPPPRAKKPAKPESKARPAVDPSVAVEQVWTRGAEWGGTLALLVVVALLFGGVVYWAFVSELPYLAMLLMLAGGAALIALSYPIVITLERPVRMTPEQAVKDFYSALSHHYPHYRRMWLLLSTAGRTSPSYATFDGFKNYWKNRLAQLRANRAGANTPLKFEVVDFKSEKSAGQAVIDARFTVQVFVRGQQAAGPVESTRVEMSLVRGPDRMWYLDQGTLPPAPVRG